MTEQNAQSDLSKAWARSVAADPWAREPATPIRRFLGGAPLAVAVKLAIVSLLVGAMLVWLDIRPADVYRYASDMLDRIWTLGFRSLRDFGDYIIAGAVIVVPIWFVMRLLSFRAR